MIKVEYVQTVRQNYDKLAEKGSEHAHQVAFFAFVNDTCNHLWDEVLRPSAAKLIDDADVYQLTYAVPNGASYASGRDENAQRTRAIQGARMKAEGVRTGAPDINFDMRLGTHKRNYCGLRIELKKPKTGVVSEQQTRSMIALRRQGYCVVVCYGYKEAVITWLAYLNGTIDDG